MKNALAPAPVARRRHARIRLGVVVGAVAVAVLGAAAYANVRQRAEAARLEAQAKEVVPLEFVAAEITRPQLARLLLGVDFSGPLVAPRTAVVRAKATGTLLSLAVGEGSRVKAGQVVGEIDIADLQSRVADRSALVESARAALAEAERQHTANTGLAGQNFISATALQTSQGRLDAARAQLLSAEAQLTTTRVGVREAALAAPIAGIVGKRHVLPGEKVSAEQPIVTIVDLGVLELAGNVGTHEVSLLRPGQATQVRVEGQAAGAPPVAGRIDRIAPAAEPGTRAIGVVVALDNQGERFRAGQYAQARVELADAVERLTVPGGAVGQASGQDFVWTLEKGVLVRRIVVTGRRDAASGRVEVSQGLPADAQVIAARFDTLKEGAPARLVERRATPAPASAAGSAPSASAPSAPSASATASAPAGALS